MINTPGIGVSIATVALRQLAYVRLEGKAIAGQRLGASARWVGKVVQALEYAGIESEGFASISILVTALYPQRAEGRPDLSYSDFEAGFEDRLTSAFAGSAWAPLLKVIDVREQWRPIPEPRIEVAIYGRPGTRRQ